MKLPNEKALVLKKVGGYLTTIAAATLSAYFINGGEIILGVVAIILSFSANYYTDFKITR